MDFWEGLLAAFPGMSFLETCACPSCGAAAARDLAPLGPTVLKRCSACALVYSSPRLSGAAREAMYRGNPGAMDPGLDAMLRRLMTERCRNMRREMFPPAAEDGSSLFEIGSGWGHFLDVCKPHFSKVAGAELSREQAAHAR